MIITTNNKLFLIVLTKSSARNKEVLSHSKTSECFKNKISEFKFLLIYWIQQSENKPNNSPLVIEI